MQDTAKFLMECGHYWVVTNNGVCPSSRPFGIIMAWAGKLYMPTGRSKKVYNQLITNRNICIVALKPGTRTWMRLTGIVQVSHNPSIKKRMWNAFPVLSKIYDNIENDELQLLEFKVKSKELHLD